MRKAITILSMALAISVCGAAVTTAEAHCGGHYGYSDRGGHCGRNYVDADGDGVCDNAKYAIRYNLNGGCNHQQNPSCYYSTTKNIKLKSPTRAGYSFKGWYADKKYKKKVTVIKKGSTGKKTLYAKWKKK